ncbi:iron-containing alcohol dehydrogenase [Pseudothermotoga sp. U03pept]|uniref:iron-containing alcohol dehydrogenase n=1 Tax=Pseudothermotoga sp. U03pept TaxID=3447012 RepID=UPI003F0D2AA8
MRLIEFLGKTIECSCGKTHRVPEIEIVCAQGLSERLAEFFQNALFVVDQNTVSIPKIPSQKTVVAQGSQRVLATMENVKMLLDLLADKEYKELVSVGSGSLTDIVRYCSVLSAKDFSCFPTAPSVDAYSSSVAPLIVDGVKKTLPAKVPRKILIDPDVIVNCPIDLLRAGIGDISSKVTARLDWVLANYLTGEQICDFVWDDLKDSLKKVLTSTKQILHRDRSSVLELMRAQLISGLNITIIGNSRPASGAEHLISHVLEMYQEIRGEIPLFHGLQVAVGTYVSLKAYDALFEDIHFAKGSPSPQERRKILVDFFNEQIADEFESVYLSKKKAANIDLGRIKDLLKDLYLSYRYSLEASLLSMGVKELLSKYDRKFLKEVIFISNTIRDRYTILDLYDQLQVLDDFCEWFLDQL